jgi:hypothetical protein
MTLLQTLTDAEGIGWTLSLRSPGATERIAAGFSNSQGGASIAWELSDPLIMIMSNKRLPIALGKKVRDDRPK